MSFLTPNTVSTVDGTVPWGMYIPPDGLNFYVALTGTGQIGQYSIDQTSKSISALTPSTVATYGGARTVVGTPDGAYVYCVNSGYDNVTQYSRSSGLLTGLTPLSVATGTYPNQAAVSPDGKFLYITNKNPGGAGSVSQFSITAGTGKLVALGTPTIACGSQPMGIAITPDGAYVYVANGNDNTISQYSRNVISGQMTALGTPTIATGVFPSKLVISPDGLNLYVANDTAATVGQYSITAGTGQLSALTPATVSGGNGPFGVAITPDGLFVYIAASDGQYILQYIRTPATGLLSANSPASCKVDPSNPAPTGSGGPQDVIVSPDGKSAYSSMIPSHSVISQFHIHS